MKTTNTLLLTFVLLTGFTGCASKMTFATSTIAPAATGTVQVKQDKNKNYITTVQVRNLAEAKNLTPAKSTYIVWMRSSETTARKLGQLTPSGKTLSGELKATSVTRPDVVFITAETMAEMQYPDGQVILTTQK